MARSFKKGVFFPLFFVKKFKDKNFSKFLFSRSIKISVQTLDSEFFIHNGKVFKPVEINLIKLGHRFGEFSASRAKFIPKVKKKQLPSKKKKKK